MMVLPLMSPANVLIISEQPVNLPALSDALNDECRAGLTAFRLLEPALPVDEGLRRLAEGDVAVLVVHAAGVRGSALETVGRARGEAPQVPVVVLTGASNDQATLGPDAIAAGAQDFLPVDQLGDRVLARVLHYALERQRLQDTLQRLALSDPLTGLYTRRGFTALLEHHLKLAPRTRGLLIVALELTSPHAPPAASVRGEYERILTDAATILHATFRASDVIARLGKTSFAALVLDAPDEARAPIAARLQLHLARRHAAQPSSDTQLSLTASFTRVDPELVLSAEEWIERLGFRRQASGFRGELQ
jgi:diguanylate cyclase (GGDEF)-like protein